MKLIADHNTNIISQLEVLESLVTWPASFKKNIPANKDGCRALSIDFVGRATLEIQILLYMGKWYITSCPFTWSISGQWKWLTSCLPTQSAWRETCPPVPWRRLGHASHHRMSIPFFYFLPSRRDRPSNGDGILPDTPLEHIKFK